MITSAQKNKEIILSNNGKTKRDFLYIKNLEKIFPKLFKLKKDQIINVVCGRNITTYDIAKVIKTFIPSTKIKKIYKKNLRDYDLQFDNKYMQKVISCEFLNLEQSLMEYMGYNEK